MKENAKSCPTRVTSVNAMGNTKREVADNEQDNEQKISRLGSELELMNRFVAVFHASFKCVVFISSATTIMILSDSRLPLLLLEWLLTLLLFL